MNQAIPDIDQKSLQDFLEEAREKVQCATMETALRKIRALTMPKGEFLDSLGEDSPTPSELAIQMANLQGAIYDIASAALAMRPTPITKSHDEDTIEQLLVAIDRLTTPLAGLHSEEINSTLVWKCIACGAIDRLGTDLKNFKHWDECPIESGREISKAIREGGNE